MWRPRLAVLADHDLPGIFGDFWGPCEAAIRLPAALQATLRVNSNLEALFAPVKPWDRNHVDLPFTWLLDTIRLYVLNSHQSDGNMTTSIYKYLRVSTTIYIYLQVKVVEWEGEEIEDCRRL